MTAAAILENAQKTEQAGRITDAIEILRKGLRQAPGNHEILLQLGQLNLKLKKYTEASQVFSRMAGTEGKMPIPAAVGLAKSFIGLGKYDQARELLQPLHAAVPNNIDVLVGLASWAISKGQLTEAESFLDDVAKQKKDVPAATHVRARLELAKKNHEEAIKLLESNMDREQPFGDSIDVWLDTLKDLKRDLYVRKKLIYFSQRYPKRPEYVFGLGITYSRAGEINNARTTFQRALKMLPNNYRILYELAVLERLAGNIELSQDLLKDVLKLKSDHPSAIRTFGVDYKYSYGDEYFTRVNTQAATMDTLAPMEQVQYHFALAKAFDDVGELQTAFKHYEVGGVKKRKIDKYVEGNSARMFEIMKKVVNKEFLPRDPSLGCPDETPVFILGMPRSGTSLMEQILSSHPDVFGAGELKYMTSATENIDIAGRRLKLGDIEPAFAYDLNASFADRGKWFADMLRSTADKPYKRIVDKMPGNFNFVGIIQAILPNAKIIHSRRHPVETCLSCYRILFAEGHQWTYDLGQLGRYYKRYWNMMEHWRQNYPGVMYEVRYEDNVADVEGQAKALINYLNLDWDDNCLNFYNTDRPVKTASASQVRKPIYKTSTNRWRKYEAYLGPLLEEIGDIVEQYESEIAHLQEAAE